MEDIFLAVLPLLIGTVIGDGSDKRGEVAF